MVGLLSSVVRACGLMFAALLPVGSSSTRVPNTVPRLHPVSTGRAWAGWSEEHLKQLSFWHSVETVLWVTQSLG